MRDPKWAANVSAEGIQAELRPPLAREVIEIIVGVVGFVPVELPHSAVKVMSAGLEDHENGSA